MILSVNVFPTSYQFFFHTCVPDKTPPNPRNNFSKIECYPFLGDSTEPFTEMVSRSHLWKRSNTPYRYAGTTPMARLALLVPLALLVLHITVINGALPEGTCEVGFPLPSPLIAPSVD